MSFTHQMEQFDRNIIHFGGLNWCQQHASLSIADIRQSLSLLSQPITKKYKNKILYQNEIEKNIEGLGLFNFAWLFKLEDQSASFSKLTARHSCFPCFSFESFLF